MYVGHSKPIDWLIGCFTAHQHRKAITSQEMLLNKIWWRFVYKYNCVWRNADWPASWHISTKRSIRCRSIHVLLWSHGVRSAINIWAFPSPPDHRSKWVKDLNPSALVRRFLVLGYTSSEVTVAARPLYTINQSIIEWNISLYTVYLWKTV